jgi:prepilin-type N-terminal cleavage/methylation domain-containing protein
MKQRKGFTLIELMIVIAIIIILAAIAIPNYLRMTDRAKVSAAASDMKMLATQLETFNTDWGKYPIVTGAEEVNDKNTVIYGELSGTDTAKVNTSSTTAVTGESGPITYVKTTTLDNLKDPWDAAQSYYYLSSTNGLTWVLYVEKPATKTYYYITSTNASLATTTTAPSAPSE